MRVDRRNEGGFSCGLVDKGLCWNKATALRHLTYRKLSCAITEKLLSFVGEVDAMVEFVQHLLGDEAQRADRERELRADVRDLRRKRDRLIELAQATDEPILSVAASLKEREAGLSAAEAELEEFLGDAIEFCTEIAPDAIKRKIEEHAERLLTMDREVGALLERLIPDRIRAVPYRQFGSNKIVLRAEFELRLANILPAQLLDALKGERLESAGWSKPIPMRIDLFEPSACPKHGVRAAELRDTGMTYQEIGRELGISKRCAWLAVQYGFKMQAAGISDPFVRVESAPTNASRWRTHEKFQTPPDRRQAG
jgi:hypothetical protein